MTVKNRVWVSPSGSSGGPSHRRRHGQGRISPQDAGIWNDQAGWWERVTSFVHSQGAASGIQLAHAGRKASTRPPWPGRGPVDPVDGGWQAVAPSPLGYVDWPTPKELTTQDILSSSTCSPTLRRGPTERVSKSPNFTLHTDICCISSCRR
ncbi:MAG TPA: hypothetical protein VHN80_05245 [Kineosporiaceae bacterium]|nr:hypothetical protein [Kineosporiaceae bacterium]